MSLPEIAERVIASLSRSAGLLRQLHDGMVRRRSAWIAARPSTVAEPAAALEAAAASLRDESAQLQELFLAAAPLLPFAAVRPADLHVDATLLADHLPVAIAARLRAAAATTTEASRAVRTEHALGERLLRFSRHAHDSMLASIAEATARTAVDVGGYDRTARRVVGALPGVGANPGTLVDGRM